jgi:hypothetical protein
MAEKLGHMIVPPEGSLVPLEAAGSDCSHMQGLSLRNVAVKLVDANNKVLYKDFGELLFTHFGVSGPTVLSASAHMRGEGCKLYIDLKPALDPNKLNERVLRDLEQYRNRTMENALTDLLPRSMIPVFLERCGIASDLQANSLKKEQRKALDYYYDLLALKEPPLRILFLLGRQFKLLLEVKSMEAQGIGRKEMAEKVGLSPYVVGKYQTQARAFKIATLRGIIEDCVSTEEQIKTGNITEILGVELFIIKHSAR